MDHKIKNSEEFLKSVVHKSTNFTTPDKYWSNFEDSLFTKIKEDTLPKESAFIVPENYLSSIENNVLNKITPKKETKVVSLKQRIKKVFPYVAAACILLLLSINYIANQTNAKISFDTIAQTDIEDWVIDHSNEISTDDFAIILNTEALNESDFAFTSIDNNDIEEYILSHEENTLINEIN